MILLAFGGLGNQLFSLASALHIAERRNTAVVVIAGNRELAEKYNQIRRKTQRKSRGKVLLIYSPRVNRYLDNLISYVENRTNLRYLKFLHLNRKLLTMTKPWDFPREILNQDTSLPWILRGFLQQPSLIDELSIENQKIIIHILGGEKNDNGNTMKIGIHLRRGDYLSIPSYGILTFDYFYGILETIGSINCQLYVASDDESTLASFGREFKRVLLAAEEFSPLKTMQILSRVDFFLMSNSTFSFWIGWKVLMSGGKVFAPIPWFRSVEVPRNYLYLKNFNLVQSYFED